MRYAGSDQELRRQAERVAALGPQVIPAIVGNLDRADERLLVAMGLVSSLIDRPQIVGALRQAVLRPDQTDRGRVAAMSILERFLGQPPDDDLLTSVRDPEGAALSALETVLQQSVGRPALLADYVEGLDRQEPDIVLAMVRALRVAAPPSAGTAGAPGMVVECLRLMSQDVREEIAAASLEALGTIRLPEAARALQTLIPVLSPALRVAAERLLRKLGFAGVEVRPLPWPDPTWRAVVSPVDGLGQQSLWFMQQEQAPGYARFLNILLNDRAGAVEAAGHAQVPVQVLPPRRPTGSVHDIALPDGSGALLMLEISFDLGRRLVRDALAQNLETQIPVAGTLRLLGTWLWGSAGADDLPPRDLPPPSESASLATGGEALVRHPAFATWTLRSETLLRAAEKVLRHGGRGLEAWVPGLAGEIVDAATAEALGRRLLAMSEWLWLAGETELAQQARAAAEGMGASPQTQPFVHALIRRDLVLFSQSLRSQPETLWDNEESEGGL